MQITGVSTAGAAQSRSLLSGVRGVKPGAGEMHERMRAQQREMKLREREDETIKSLQKSISDITNSGMDQETIDAQVKNLSAQIQSIYNGRTEREKQAREAELKKQKEEVEEAKRKQEENSEKNKPAAEGDDAAISREDAEGMIKVAISHDGINALKKVKAAVTSEAGQIERDIASDSARPAPGTGVKAEDLERVRQETGMDFSRADGDDFRKSHAANLNESIENLESAIQSEMEKMNREANEMAEGKPAEKPTEQTRRTEQAEAEQTGQTEQSPGKQPENKEQPGV